MQDQTHQSRHQFEGVSNEKTAQFTLVVDDYEVSDSAKRTFNALCNSSGGRRINKESKCRIRLINLDIRVRNTNIRLTS
jgi:hypothetical protein